MMIKLIASDLDGTLLQNGNRSVSAKALEYIDKLNKRGILFAAASGRQYTNLRKLFGPVKDDIAYICENGALVKYKGETLFKKPIERSIGYEILEDVYNKEGCEVLLSGEDISYIIPKASDYEDHIRNYVGNDTTVVKDFNEVEEDFIKISVYAKDGIDKHSDYFHEKWGDKVKTTVSGQVWLDFVDIEVNKGRALEMLQKKHGYDYEETMCFGDNYNDIEMFEKSYFSYAMTMAAAEIRRSARYITTDVETILFDVDKMYEWQK